MSNPCINRWGLNSFWHHYWYSDSTYASNLKQDKIFIDLIQTYLVYGSSTPTSFFWNSYWYKTSAAPSQSILKDYYRWITVSNTVFQMTNTYRLRIVSEEIFQTRISILRFGAWIVVNFYWFQPDKNKKKRSLRVVSHKYTHAEHSMKLSTAPLLKFRSLTNALVPSYLQNKNQYNF